MIHHHDIHIWRANWRTLLPKKAWASLLSDDELLRAERFHFIEHKNRFLVTRGLLRILIGRYTEQKPTSIQFHYSDTGKPYIDASLSFSLSHSASWVILGLNTMTPNIGIDIETTAQAINTNSVMRHYFTDTEIRAIQALPVPEQDPAFFRLWTHKEAFLKAIGVGLGLSTKTIEVSSGAKPTFVSLPPAFDHAEWHLHTVNVPNPMVGSLAIDESVATIHYYDCETEIF